jgi:hypothetical protein
MIRLAPTLLLLVAAVLPQQKWREIGTTSTGNPVFLDGHSVKKGSDGVITASVRVTYSKPLDTPTGKVTSSRAVAMFDCAKRLVATKESVFFFDEKKGLEYSHRKITKPGFGPVPGNTFASVALNYLCAK